MSTYVNTTFYLRSCELKIKDVLTTATTVKNKIYTSKGKTELEQIYLINKAVNSLYF